MGNLISQETVVKSAMVKKIMYNFVNETLKVQFPNEIVYEYYNVPQDEYANLCTSESAGKYFIDNIKNKYEFKKLD